MTYALAPPLRVLWSHPQVTGFVVVPPYNRIVATLFNEGVVGLDFGGAVQWRLEEDLPVRQIVRGTESYSAWNGKLHHTDILKGGGRQQELEGSLIHVTNDGKGLLLWHHENDWDKDRYHSRIEFRTLLDNSTVLVWVHKDEGAQRACTAFGTESVVASNNLFIARRPARLLNIDVTSGTVHWDADLNDTKPEPGIGVPADLRTTPLVADDLILAPTPFGFGAFKLDNGALVWRHHVHAGPFNVYNDRLYMATGINFTGYRIVDMNTGETLFQREVSDDIAKKYRFGYVKLNSGFAVTETNTFVGDNFGRLWALERDTGEPVWFHHPDKAAPYVAARKPVMEGNRLYINGFSTDPNRPQFLYCYEQA